MFELILGIFGIFARMFGRLLGRHVRAQNAARRRCSTCGVVVASQATVCARCGTSLPPPVPPLVAPPRVSDPVQSHANWSLGVALASVPLCCGLPALLAGVLGLRTILVARRRGVPVPPQAVVALALAFVSLAISGGMTYMVLASKWQHDDRVRAIEARLAGRRERPALTRDVACDLVEQHLVNGLDEDYPLGHGKVRCEGSFEPGMDSARLKDVELEDGFSHVFVDACFGRSSRWFVVTLRRAESCPTGPWPAPALNTEDELRAAETRWRQAYAEQRDRGQIEAFESALRKLRDELRATPRGPQECPELEHAPTQGSDPRLHPYALELSALDAQQALAEQGSGNWGFMTADELRDALDRTADDRRRARILRSMASQAGPYLVAYQADERAWPQVRERPGGSPSDDLTFGGGRYSGWLVLVDARQARVVCEAPFHFENSAQVEYDKRSLFSRKSNLIAALQADLERRFQDAASTAVKSLTHDRVRLGYRLLE